MKLIRFDMDALYQWSFAHILKMREAAGEFNMTASDKFAMFITEMQGNILVTREFDRLDSRSVKTETPLVPIRGSIFVRLVLGSEHETPKIFVSVRALEDWCKRNSANYLQIRREMITAGLAKVGVNNRCDKDVYLNRGVPSCPTGKSRAIEFDYEKVQGVVGDVAARQGNVVSIAAR